MLEYVLRVGVESYIQALRRAYPSLSPSGLWLELVVALDSAGNRAAALEVLAAARAVLLPQHSAARAR